MALRVTSAHARIVVGNTRKRALEVQIGVGGSVGVFAAQLEASAKRPVQQLPKGGVNELLSVFNRIVRPGLLGFDFSSQDELDRHMRLLDGTKTYAHVGGATTLSTSIAAAEAASKEIGFPLYEWIGGKGIRPDPPRLVADVVSKGERYNGLADTYTFLAVSYRKDSLSKTIFSLIDLYLTVGRLLSKRDRLFCWGKNDEGAWISSLSETEILSILEEAVAIVKSSGGVSLGLGIDFKADEHWDEQSEMYVDEVAGSFRTRDEQIDYVMSLMDRFDLRYIEDPLDTRDTDAYSALIEQIGDREVLLCWGSIHTTISPDHRLQPKPYPNVAASIRLDEVGDLTHIRELVEVAKGLGADVVISEGIHKNPTGHLVHLAIGFRADAIRLGLSGGCNVTKLNELIRIWEENSEN